MAKNQTTRPYRPCVPGDDLQDQDLAELCRILAQKTRAGLTGHAGALCRTDGAQRRRETRAQKRQSQTAESVKKCLHDRVPP
mgnify:CR=1 FL=1